MNLRFFSKFLLEKKCSAGIRKRGKKEEKTGRFPS